MISHPHDITTCDAIPLDAHKIGKSHFPRTRSGGELSMNAYDAVFSYRSSEDDPRVFSRVNGMSREQKLSFVGVLMDAYTPKSSAKLIGFVPAVTVAISGVISMRYWGNEEVYPGDAIFFKETKDIKDRQNFHVQNKEQIVTPEMYPYRPERDSMRTPLNGSDSIKAMINNVKPSDALSDKENFLGVAVSGWQRQTGQKVKYITILLKR